MFEKVAVIIQGQYVDEFTYDSIQVYLSIISASNICLSIWKDLTKQGRLEIEKIMASGVEVIFNAEPTLAGFQNVNKQIVSSKAGIVWAKQNNFKYSLKTRADHRITDLSALCNISRDKLNSKIVAFQTADFIRSPYLVNDFIFMSETNCLLDFFDIELCPFGNDRDLDRVSSRSFIRMNKDINDYLNFIGRDFPIAEKFLISRFINKKGFIIPTSYLLQMLQSAYFILNYFYLINPNAIGYKTIKNYKALNYNGSSYNDIERKINRGGGKLILTLFSHVFRYYYIKYKAKAGVYFRAYKSFK